MSDIAPNTNPLAQAVTLHQKGLLAQAEGFYMEALRINPEQFDALHLLGVVAQQQGQASKAVDLISQAIAINPEVAAAYSNLGLALMDLGRNAEAEGCFNKALDLQTDYVDAYFNKGNVLHKLGKLEEAVISFSRALNLRPSHAAAWFNQAKVLMDLGRHEEAITSSRQAIRYNPNDADGFYNLGNALQELNRFEEALAQYLQALKLNPNNPEILNNCGSCLIQLNRFESALSYIDQALRLNPQFANSLNNRGHILLKFNQLEEALDCFNQALQIQPNNCGYLINKGATLDDLGRYKECLETYAEALRLFPNSADAHWNESLARLANGELELGFAKYEWRRKTKTFNNSNFNYTQPLWLGQVPIAGKTLLIVGEQGFGDTIQFCRFGQQATALGAKVLLAVPKELKHLIRSLEGVEGVYTEGDVVQSFDFYCPMLSLPLALKIKLETIPAKTKYLTADPDRVASWSERLGPKNLPRIGLAWSGRPTHLNDSNRSIPLTDLVRLAVRQGKFYCIQKEIRETDRALLHNHPEISFFGNELLDFSDTAALIENLDLVITVDTSVAHLAAALGKPVWLLLSKRSDWRWLKDRSDSPWYPSVTLFRQTQLGDWASVIDRVSWELSQHLGLAPPVSNTATQKTLAQAIEHQRQGQHREARTLYQTLLRDDPDNFDALHYLGLSFVETGEHTRGIGLIRQALRINPVHAAALVNLGTALSNNNQLYEALDCFAQALKLQPNNADTYNNQGNALLKLKRHAEALQSYDIALQLQPTHAIALNNRGNALKELGDPQAAIESYQAAIRLNPYYADAFVNQGNAYKAQARFNDALASYGQALRIKPNSVEAFYNQATVFEELRRYDQAAQAFALAQALNPNYPYAVGQKLFCRLYCCDWTNYAADRDAVIQAVRANQKAINPFGLLAISVDKEDHLRCAQVHFAETYGHIKPGLPPLPLALNRHHEKIRIAYLSADFRDHAVAYLLAGLFENHDRQRFETYAISLSPVAESPMRQRLQGAFDYFADINNASDLDVALWMRTQEIDIAIDLTGYTGKGRTGILAHRPAPIQVSYLGYPSTLGGNHIDYLIADRQIIPPDQQPYYTEKLVYLPDTYWVNDDKLPQLPPPPSRAQAGLPDQGFVFCCFNNTFKITPEVFACWMRLLHRVESSVLWLYGGGAEIAKINLRKKAANQGINPERLIFAKMLPDRIDHLARHPLADLFLDTLPYNAHTTASDALWAGLPILTCQGSAFPGRVAASLLQAIGLPELITQNMAEYENLALQLATQPRLLAEIKAKLLNNRETYPLFDTERFRNHLETAYIAMMERYLHGEPAVPIAISPNPR